MRYDLRIFKSYKEVKVFITECLGSWKAFQSIISKRYKTTEMDLCLYNQNKLCESIKMDRLLQKI